jgi:hypothetical protein
MYSWPSVALPAASLYRPNGLAAQIPTKPPRWLSGTSVYVAGYFGSSTAGLGFTTLTNADATDGFVAKLTDAGSMGSFAWAQRTGSTGGGGATALAVIGTSMYVAGHFASPTASFGSTSLANVASTNSQDVYVAKLTDASGIGRFIWAQRAGGLGNEYACALTLICMTMCI